MNSRDIWAEQIDIKLTHQHQSRPGDIALLRGEITTQHPMPTFALSGLKAWAARKITPQNHGTTLESPWCWWFGWRISWWLPSGALNDVYWDSTVSVKGFRFESPGKVSWLRTRMISERTNKIITTLQYAAVTPLWQGSDGSDSNLGSFEIMQVGIDFTNSGGWWVMVAEHELSIWPELHEWNVHCIQLSIRPFSAMIQNPRKVLEQKQIGWETISKTTESDNVFSA